MQYKVILQSGEVQYPDSIGEVQTMSHDIYALTTDDKVLVWAETQTDGTEIWKELPEELADAVLSYWPVEEYPNSIFE